MGADDTEEVRREDVFGVRSEDQSSTGKGCQVMLFTKEYIGREGHQKRWSAVSTDLARIRLAVSSVVDTRTLSLWSRLST